jgi:uncharacterized protein YceK
MDIILYRAIVLIMAATALNGCGTIITLSMQEKDIVDHCNTLPRAYSGTVFDSRCIYHPEHKGTNNAELFCLIDLPLSLGMDTIVLPYTGYKQIQHGSYGSECGQNKDSQ